MVSTSTTSTAGAPNSTGAITTSSDLKSSDTFSFSGIPLQMSKTPVPSMEFSSVPKVSMEENRFTDLKSAADHNSTLQGSVIADTVTINTNLTHRSNKLELISKDYREGTDTFSTTATVKSSISQTSVPGNR